MAVVRGAEYYNPTSQMFSDQSRALRHGSGRSSSQRNTIEHLRLMISGIVSM